MILIFSYWKSMICWPRINTFVVKFLCIQSIVFHVKYPLHSRNISWLISWTLSPHQPVVTNYSCLAHKMISPRGNSPTTKTFRPHILREKDLPVTFQLEFKRYLILWPKRRHLPAFGGKKKEIRMSIFRWISNLARMCGQIILNVGETSW